MKAFASSGPCGEMITTVSALLLITRAVNSAMALIEFCTSTEDSRPTSGTMIGGCGSFAAEQLARAGVSVGLFDGRLPGEPKACGGGVTSKALKAWPHLLEAVGRTIDELDMYSPSGKHLHLQLDEPFAVYSRIAFDTFLRERAQKAGAKVLSEKVSARGFKRVVSKSDALDPVATAPGTDTDDGWIVRTQSDAEFS